MKQVSYKSLFFLTCLLVLPSFGAKAANPFAPNAGFEEPAWVDGNLRLEVQGPVTVEFSLKDLESKTVTLDGFSLLAIAQLNALRKSSDGFLNLNIKKVGPDKIEFSINADKSQLSVDGPAGRAGDWVDSIIYLSFNKNIEHRYAIAPENTLLVSSQKLSLYVNDQVLDLNEGESVEYAPTSTVLIEGTSLEGVDNPLPDQEEPSPTVEEDLNPGLEETPNIDYTDYNLNPFSKEALAEESSANSGCSLISSSNQLSLSGLLLLALAAFLPLFFRLKA